ncbi:MAG TPA: hypothetical protein VJV75_03745 [Candidatus Polarisedimenticolia bacterium]|nr:hypothetical protein [Candidatus Polarisedimenticolia bacterium]
MRWIVVTALAVAAVVVGAVLYKRSQGWTVTTSDGEQHRIDRPTFGQL